MGDLTIVTLCQVLANLTQNRCGLVENSNTCRCIDDIITPSKPSIVISTPPAIMFSEVILIFIVLGLWLSAIGFCLNQYKSLRRFETQVFYYGNRKDPLNIGDIKIVAREQDSIIYKKKRYSTLLDTHINSDELKRYHYVQQYLPRNVSNSPPSITALVIHRDDLTAGIPLSMTTPLYNSSIPIAMTTHLPLSTHDEIAEEQSTPTASPLEFPQAPASSLVPFFSLENSSRKPLVHRTDSGRLSVGLTVPQVSSPNSLHSSWNSSQIYETSSAQHLAVPSGTLRSTRYSDGNISLSPPLTSDNQSTATTNEELIDPRLIPNTVRRSLLALHRESQENIHTHRGKEKTQSENDVHGSFAPWKMKMKLKLKRTHHQQPSQAQPLPAQTQETSPGRAYSRTLSIFPTRNLSNDHERRVSEFAMTNPEFRFSTPPPRNVSVFTAPTFRRSLKHYPKYSTQSTTESDPTQNDVPTIKSVFVSIDDEESAATILDKSDQS